MRVSVQDIKEVRNAACRQVLFYTAKRCQFVRPHGAEARGEIGAGVRRLDQFFRVEEGSEEAMLDDVRAALRASAVAVPAGTRHNITTGTVPLKLYAPPNHRDDVVHQTRQDGEADHERFDGKTTE